MFQALAQFHQDRGLLTQSPNTTFYDLNTSLTAPSESSVPFAPTLTDTYLIGIIQYMLLEQLVQTPQFTYAQMSGALNRVTNRFLLQTGVRQSYSFYSIAPPTQGRITLPTSVMDIRAAYWTDVTSKLTYPLYRSSEFELNTFSTSWYSTPGLPSVYSTNITPPTIIQVGPVPINTGTLSLVTTNSMPAFDPTGATPTTLTTPDDWCFALIFGTLAELLMTDGPSRDPSRAQYCQTVYDAAVQAASIFPSVMTAQVLDLNLPITSMVDLDQYLTQWQNITGVATYMGMSGRNIVAFAPGPGPLYPSQITMDFIRNMYVPSSDADYLQVPQEHLETILDNAQYLSCFKMSGQEFSNTLGLNQNFLKLCAVHNHRMSAASIYRDLMTKPANLQSLQSPAQYISQAPSPYNQYNQQ